MTRKDSSRLKALTSFPEVPGSIPNTYMTAHGSLILVLRDPTPHRDIHAGRQNINAHEIKIINYESLLAHLPHRTP